MIPRITSFDQYKEAYERSLYDPDNFWSEVAAGFRWRKKWDRIHSGGFENVDFKWFEGAQLNITDNCLDRHTEAIPDKTAIIWEPNNPDEEGRKLSYQELHREVC